MFIAAAQIRLRLEANHSLKGKRHVVKSVIDRLKDKFGVAAAEVESHELWQIADIGIAAVSGNALHAEDIIRNAVKYVETSRPDVELVDVAIDTVPFP